MKSKKSAIFFLLMIVFTIFPIPTIEAESKVGYVIASKIPYTKAPNIENPTTKDFVAPNVLHYLDSGDEIKPIGEKIPSTVSSCKTDFYQVSFNYPTTGRTYVGYVCGDYVQFEVDVTPYVEEFTNAGFPKHYWKYLALLKNDHPNWTFQAYQTGIKWSDALDNEAIVGKSLIHKNYSGDGGYLDISNASYNYLTDSWNSFDGSSWFAANRQTVAYYMDPRNFLNETYVFMFENLTYQPETQTKEAVSQILNSEFLNQYIDTFMQSAETYQVSPIHLASRVRQEVGTTVSVATSGAAFEKDGKVYQGLYNFYNIGATSGADNWKKGLIWANGGVDQTVTTFGRPWNTPEKSIMGGAEYIAHYYINQKQDTLYYQKWNVASQNPFTHQYMTNIMAPMSEAATTFSSYQDIGLTQKGENSFAFTFNVPIYLDMPEEKTELPTPGNPNDYLKTISINGTELDNFSSEKTDYTVYVSDKKVKIEATTINNYAKINGIGEIELSEKETKIPITVTAQNGATRQYHLTLISTNSDDTNDIAKISIKEVIHAADIRIEENILSKFSFQQTVASLKEQIHKVNDKVQVTVTDSNGTMKTDDKMLATGDQIQFIADDQTEIYQVLIYGDLNSDGKLDLTDILYVQRHYLHVDGSQLAGIYYKASDVDKNGVIDLSDLLQFQRQYLQVGTIQQ